MTNKTEPQITLNPVNPLRRQYPPRRRVQLLCPEQSITEPDENNSFSMSSIKKRLDRGIPPVLTDDAFYSLEPLKYTNLQDALAFHQSVTERFESLPSELRKMMGNNIHNFESFITNPENAEVLLKHGIITKRDATNQQIVDGLKDLADKFNEPTSLEVPLRLSKKPKE